MDYPEVFCIKCKSHTNTLGKHTVILGNNRRALKGVCPVCSTETYRFMPNKDETKVVAELALVSSKQLIRKQKSNNREVLNNQEPIRLIKKADLSHEYKNSKLSALVGRSRPSQSQELFFNGILFVLLGLIVTLAYALIIRIH
ncbi:MAG: DUF5679 domain-containing protein [Proteobacteria bacterium]|nr:DUF5679 domain-containing protein [Pseudomonadota bacterium]